MAHPKNEAAYALIRARYHTLCTTHTVGDLPPKRIIAQELAAREGKSESAAYQMVCYYLRGGNKVYGSKDARRAYSAAELRNLDVMSTAERAAYAKRTNRSVRAVDAALARFRLNSKLQMRQAPDALASTIAEDNHYDFADAAHLKLRGFARQDVATARTTLNALHGLSLRSPNILYHAKSNRKFYLVAAHQDSLLKDTKHFLYICSDLIAKGWVAADVDPITEAAQTPSVLSSGPKGSKREIRELMACSTRVCEILEKQLRDPIIQEGTPLGNSLKTLKIWLDRALELAYPKDFYIDDVKAITTKPKDLSEHLVIGTHYTCTKCACRADSDTKICPSCHSDKDVVRVSELESDTEKKSLNTSLTTQEDEDAWMKDWKPKGADL